MLVSVDHDLGAIEIVLIGLETACNIWVDTGIVVQRLDSNLFFSLVLIFVPLRFVKFRNLTSVLNGWLDAPWRGLLGFFSAEFCFWVWRYTSFLWSSRPQGALCRCSGHPSPLSQFWSNLDHTSNKHTHMYLHTTHRFSKYPDGPHFFNIYCLQFDKKIV